MQQWKPVVNTAVEDLQQHIQEFETVTLRRLPFYRYLAGRIAQDPEVSALLLLAPPERRWVTLLLAAVHDRLLEVFDAVDADSEVAAQFEPLCAWYPSTASDPRPVGVGRLDPWPRFREIALDDPRVTADIATRGTQTNEVGRSATTVLALGAVQAEVDRPLALVEVGASAGLNLLLDRYHYRYRPDDTTGSDPSEGPGRRCGDSVSTTSDSSRDHRRPHAAGEAAVEILEPDIPAPIRAPLTLEAHWRGPRRPPVPASMPAIGTRIGVDAQPIDVTDPVAARWLVACQWPEQLERLDRCRQAITVAQTEPPRIVEGDLVDTVASLISAIPPDHHPVVLSTWCLAYLEKQDQVRFLRELDRAARDRDLTLIYQEQPVAVPGLDPPARPDGVDDHRPTALCRQDWRRGHQTAPVRLADQHPHGTWLRWFG